jgi:hypothetical protein
MAVKQNKLAQDLTLVLMRSNGIPRAFRIRVPTLIRSLLTLSGVLTIFGLATITLVVLLLWNNRGFTLPRIQINQRVDAEQTPAAAPVVANPEPVSTSTSKVDSIPAPDAVLREELIKVQNLLQGRKQMDTGTDSAAAASNGPLTLFARNSIPLAANEVFLEIKNVRASRQAGVPVLEFDLQNTHPTQQQVRGHITVVAKTASGLYTYPEQTLSPRDNILINYAKGETFAIARFRQAAARFPKIPADSGTIFYQIVLFATDGKIIQTSHAEGK